MIKMQTDYELEKNDEFAKNSSHLSHFVKSKEFFELLNILLNSASSNEDSSKEYDAEQEKILRKSISLVIYFIFEIKSFFNIIYFFF
jgi:hypothetical protein